MAVHDIIYGPSRGFFYLTKEKVGIISRSPRVEGWAQKCGHPESLYLSISLQLSPPTGRKKSQENSSRNDLSF